MWPFNRFPSLAKYRAQNCRWCRGQIGDDGRYPIPLCDACYSTAWNDQAPPALTRSWMMAEFASEVREYFKRVMRRRA